MRVISCKKAKALGRKRYYTGRPCKHGHIAERYVTGGCIVCANLDQLRYYRQNPEKYMMLTIKYRDTNRERINRIQRDYYARHSERVRATSAEHRARRIKRVPQWSEKEKIQEFYANCPEGHEVDHIYPLQGERVSGLHVLRNLQYLTRSANRSKRNRVMS